MMEPRIQFAQTEDGVSIAYWTMGEGMPPLVQTSGGPLNHLQLEWDVLENRGWQRELAKERMQVRFDVRGSGLSSGDISDTSLDAWVRDLGAVVDHLQLDRFTLFASMFWGPAAIAYAAQNPDRVSHLVLWCTAARGSHFFASPRNKALAALAQTDWELYTETVAHLTYGWSAGEPARQSAARIREVLTPKTLRAAYAAVARMDAEPYISLVKCPTLVQHRRRIALLEAGAARELAAKIPNARLNLLEGDATPPYLGDTEAALAAMADFLGEPQAAAAPAARTEAGAFRTLLFTDVEDSTALTERLGDAKARDVLRAHERLVRGELRTHSGSEIKTVGDGFMASFPSATKATECAIAVQRACDQQNEATAEPIHVRIGLNAGEPIEEEQDLFGTAVIMAARIAGRATGGEILVSNVIRELVAGKGFLFADRGETELRGFEDPVRLYEVRWREEG